MDKDIPFNIPWGDSISEYTYRIDMTMLEKENEFIFQKISPYCESVVETRLSKEDIFRALKLYSAVKDFHDGTQNICPCCGIPRELRMGSI